MKINLCDISLNGSDTSQTVVVQLFHCSEKGVQSQSGITVFVFYGRKSVFNHTGLIFYPSVKYCNDLAVKYLNCIRGCDCQCFSTKTKVTFHSAGWKWRHGSFTAVMAAMREIPATLLPALPEPRQTC